jgi:hypothetical protein
VIEHVPAPTNATSPVEELIVHTATSLLAYVLTPAPADKELVRVGGVAVIKYVDEKDEESICMFREALGTVVVVDVVEVVPEGGEV